MLWRDILMTKNNRLNIIKAWHNIEYLNPLELKTDQVKFRVDNHLDLPWHNNKQYFKSGKETFVIYIGVCDTEEAIKAVKLALNDNKIEYDDIDYKHKTAYGQIEVDAEGIFVKGSLSLSTFPFALGQLRKGNRQYSNWYHNFQEIKEELTQIADNILSKNSKVTYDQLLELLHKIAYILGWKPQFHEKPFWYKVTEIKGSSKKNNQNEAILNSFFARDIERVIGQLNTGEIGTGLLSYLSGDKINIEDRKDIDKDPNLLFQILSPENIPLAKWPSNDKFKLSLMQQAAVNQITKELKDNNGIFSVNGPPGTGKTTLLKDVIAAILTDRAQVLMGYDNPTKAFTKLKKIELTSNFSATVNVLAEDIQGFGILIGSSNNTAVENISMELPEEKAIYKDYISHQGANYFHKAAQPLSQNGSKRWGLFTARLGNRTNIKDFLDAFWNNTQDSPFTFLDFYREIKKIPKEQRLKDWELARESFKKALENVQRHQQEALYFYNKVKRENKLLLELEKKSFWRKGVREKIYKELQSIESELHEEKSKRCIMDKHFWGLENKERQQLSPWVTDEYTRARSYLFLEAMNLHEKFIIAAIEKMYGNLVMFKELGKLDINQHKDAVKPIWDSFTLVIPVVSSAFASISSLFKGLDGESFGWLFIDEAGQAVPQHAVGSIWRAKKTIVVGDPKQVEPVATQPDIFFDELSKAYNVSKKYVAKNASVQSIADMANVFGTYLGEENPIWIGSPLWVHRRCIKPMFQICNRIAYNDQMVLPEDMKNIEYEGLGSNRWFDIKGNATYKHFVPEQGAKVVELIEKAFAKSKDEIFPSIYVISPFTSVIMKVKDLLEKNFNLITHGKTEKKSFTKWINSSVGTVHTFQGKEADMVIVILGVDPSKKQRVANWATEKPNIINVAVSRAKFKIYFIGDKEVWGDLPNTKEVLDEFEKLEIENFRKSIINYKFKPILEEMKEHCDIITSILTDDWHNDFNLLLDKVDSLNTIISNLSHSCFSRLNDKIKSFSSDIRHSDLYNFNYEDTVNDYYVDRYNYLVGRDLKDEAWEKAREDADEVGKGLLEELIEYYPEIYQVIDEIKSEIDLTINCLLETYNFM